MADPRRRRDAAAKPGNWYRGLRGRGRDPLGGALSQTRLLRDLLLLTAFAAVALTDFVFHALPAYDLQTRGYGAGAGIAMTILAAATFVAVSFVPVQQRLVARPRRALVLAVLATVGWIGLGEVVEVVNGLVLGRGPVGLDAPVWTVAALLCFVLLLARASASPMVPAPMTPRQSCSPAPRSCSLAPSSERWGCRGPGRLGDARRRTPGWSVRDADRGQRDPVSPVAAPEKHVRRWRPNGCGSPVTCTTGWPRTWRSSRAFGPAGRLIGADHPVAVAAARALATSRGQIVDLEASECSEHRGGAPRGSGGGACSVRCADHRSGALEDQAEPSSTERRELVRIAREAIANAVRHGKAKHITVTLGSRDEPFLLRVTDDGSGLPAAGRRTAPTAGTGLGMRAMGARSRRIGAQLHASRRERGGTEIEVAPAPADARSGVDRRVRVG